MRRGPLTPSGGITRARSGATDVASDRAGCGADLWDGWQRKETLIYSQNTSPTVINSEICRCNRIGIDVQR